MEDKRSNGSFKSLQKTSIPTGSPLDWGQLRAVQAAKCRRNIFLTGAGGSGKSFVLKYVLDHFKANNWTYIVTGMTAAVAKLVDGITFSKCSGIQLGTKTVEEYFNHLHTTWKRHVGSIESTWQHFLKQRKKRMGIVETSQKEKDQFVYERSIEHAWGRYLYVDAWIIDETSMLNPDFFAKVVELSDRIRLPLGRPSLMWFVMGDFFQIPYISKDRDHERIKLFRSDVWKELNFTVIQLREAHRQNDKKFIECCNHLRKGTARAEHHAMLNSRVKKFVRKNGQVIERSPSGDVVTWVFGLKRDVRARNDECLNSLPGAIIHLHGLVEFYDRSRDVTQIQKLDYRQDDQLVEIVDKVMERQPVEQDLQFKIGCDVIVLVNFSSLLDVVNGSTGTVVGFGKADLHNEKELMDKHQAQYSKPLTKQYMQCPDYLKSIIDESIRDERVAAETAERKKNDDMQRLVENHRRMITDILKPRQAEIDHLLSLLTDDKYPESIPFEIYHRIAYFMPEYKEKQSIALKEKDAQRESKLADSARKIGLLDHTMSSDSKLSSPMETDVPLVRSDSSDLEHRLPHMKTYADEKKKSTHRFTKPTRPPTVKDIHNAMELSNCKQYRCITHRFEQIFSSHSISHWESDEVEIISQIQMEREERMKNKSDTKSNRDSKDSKDAKVSNATRTEPRVYKGYDCYVWIYQPKRHQLVQIPPVTFNETVESMVVPGGTQWKRRVEFTQIPLLPSYAMTTHKIQGTTLNQLRACLNKRNTFEYGQLYVIVNRLRTLDGLFLNEYDPLCNRVDNDVVEYYKELDEKDRQRWIAERRWLLMLCKIAKSKLGADHPFLGSFTSVLPLILLYRPFYTERIRSHMRFCATHLQKVHRIQKNTQPIKTSIVKTSVVNGSGIKNSSVKVLSKK